MAKTIGELQYLIDAETSGFEAKVAEADARIERLGETADDTGRKVDRATDKGEGGFARMGKAASAAQETISKIVIPATIAIALTRIIERFDQLQAQADQYEAKIQGLGQVFEAFALEQARANEAPLTPLEQQIRLIEQRSKVERESIQNAAQQEAALIRSQNLIKQGFRALADAPSANDVLQRANRESDQIVRRANQAIERARRQAAEAAEKESRSRAAAIEAQADQAALRLGSVADQQRAALNDLVAEFAPLFEGAITDAEERALQRLLELRKQAIDEEYQEKARQEEAFRNDQAQAEADRHEQRMKNIERERDAEIRAISAIKAAQDREFGIEGRSAVAAVGAQSLLGAIARQARSNDAAIYVGSAG